MASKTIYVPKGGKNWELPFASGRKRGGVWMDHFKRNESFIPLKEPVSLPFEPMNDDFLERSIDGQVQFGA